MQIFIRFKYFELTIFECMILHDLKTGKIKLILRTNLVIGKLLGMESKQL